MRIAFLLLPALFLVSLAAPAHPAQNIEERLQAIVQVRVVVPRTARTARNLGTEREGNGVVIDPDGHILTIGYIILEAEKIELVLSGGKRIGARFVAYDHDTGFGLVRASEPFGAAPMELGDSSKVKRGDAVLVAGHGGPNAVLGAQVISRREFAGWWEYLLDHAIFTTPPHPDFAGAALIGPDGRLLGVGSLFSQTVVPGVGVIPGNMFVPIDLLKPILADMKASGRSNSAPRPWMGLRSEEVRGRIFVNRVSKGGPAEQAGVKPGDIILAVNQKEVTNLAGFYRKVWALGSAGVEVPLSVLQGRRMRLLTIRSTDRRRFLRLK
ncbi:MAG: S1C family serine protease [bacterium]